LAQPIVIELIGNKGNVKKSLLSIDKQNIIDSKLLTWIIKDLQSFRVVENRYFIDFISSICDEYKLLNRKQVTTNINNLYITYSQKIKDMVIENDSQFSISLDIWTANNKKSYLGVKNHYLTNNFELKSFVLLIILMIPIPQIICMK
jgi:hypothetical protein